MAHKKQAQPQVSKAQEVETEAKGNAAAAASPRGDDRATASNVNIVVMPDIGAALGGLLLQARARRGSMRAGKRRRRGAGAKTLRALIARQARANKKLRRAIRAIASRRRRA